MKKRLLIATGGGDCPGLNAVIRAIGMVPGVKVFSPEEAMGDVKLEWRSFIDKISQLRKTLNRSII